VTPAERSARGQAMARAITGQDRPEPDTVFAASWRDFVFAEVWDRPGLDRRARFLIAIAGAAIAVTEPATLDGYVRGALAGELTQVELREAALHVAVYGGWGAGERIDQAITRVAGPPDTPMVPLRSAPWQADQRQRDGQDEFARVMVFPGPGADNPYQSAGILDFVFAEMWCRPGLDQRSRRWLTLVGVCHAGAPTPIDTHIHAAMASGNCNEAELLEFVLQYAIHAGWPRASLLSRVIVAQAARVAAGQSFYG
jgi:4-carboxymuconolactone decarboxylase